MEKITESPLVTTEHRSASSRRHHQCLALAAFENTCLNKMLRFKQRLQQQFCNSRGAPTTLQKFSAVLGMFWVPLVTTEER